MSKIPVTVLTGFLGSGKTTLLNRILTEAHGKRIAVIENEFGEIGIDQALVINADEEVFEMNNGCICCTVRGDLIRILGGLMKRRTKFDHVLVETTGMADPSPVAHTFFVDDEVASNFALDGIVTMVDAKHASLHIEDSSECKEQIAFADVLVLNKTDLVSPREVDALEARIRSMNAIAKVERAVHAAVSIADVLDVGGFDLGRALDTKPTFLEPEVPFEWVGAFDLTEGIHALVVEDGADETMEVLLTTLATGVDASSREASDRAVRAWSGARGFAGPGGTIATDGTVVTLDLRARGPKRFTLQVPRRGRYALYTQHLPSEFSARVEGPRGAVAPGFAREFAAGHSHDDQVTSVGIHLEAPVDGDKLNNWLSVLLRDKGTDIFRMKGILDIRGSDSRYVFQGVHMLFDGREDRPWGTTKRASDLRVHRQEAGPCRADGRVPAMSGVSLETAGGRTELPERWHTDIGDYVIDASISCDGRLAAIATGGGDVVVVEIATGDERWRKAAHEGSVLALGFSPREAVLASAGQDGRACLWQANGTVLAELPGNGGWVDHLLWSPDGRFLATSCGRVVRLWTNAGEPRLETEPHPSTVAGIAWRKDSRELATCCYGGVHLWAVESGAKAGHLGWKGSLVSIAWSPDGMVIASGSQDSSVHFWRLPSGQDSEMREYPFKPKTMAWDAHSTMLATAGDATITIWTFGGSGPEGKPPQQLEGHKALCTALAFAPRTGRLASGGREAKILMWEPRRGSKPFRHAFLADEITKLVWHPDGKGLLAADCSGRVGFLDVE